MDGVWVSADFSKVSTVTGVLITGPETVAHNTNLA